MKNLIKFIFGWVSWFLIFILSILFNLICWNWKETVSMDFEVIITEICGKSTWNSMFLNNLK